MLFMIEMIGLNERNLCILVCSIIQFPNCPDDGTVIVNGNSHK